MMTGRERRLGMLPAEAAHRWREREALVFKADRWTYTQFDAEVDRVAKGLIAIGVEPGEHVALWITNRPEFLFLFFAIIKIGAVAIPFSTRLRTSDLGYAVRQSDTVTLVSVGRSGPVDYAEMLGEVLGTADRSATGQLHYPDLPALRRVVLIGDERAVEGAHAWDAFLSDGQRITDEALSARAGIVDPNGLAMIFYTSGSTGYPKGVMLNHDIVGRSSGRLAAMGATQYDVHLNYLPLFHILPIAHIVLQSMLCGGKQVLMETFDPVEALALIEAEGVTAITGFDTHYRDLMSAKEINSSIDVSSLRVGLLAAGLASTQPIAVEAQKALCPTVSTYGSTESGSGITLTALDGTLAQRTAASGYPLPGAQVRIVDPETGADVKIGEQGEILLRSSDMMLGYYNDAEETEKVLDAKGWLRTGDAGLLRQDGHLQFVGRYKDMLKIGGENVSAAEVELVLQQIDGVAQVAVVGAPDARLHEVVAAFIVPDMGADITLQGIETFCRGRIAGFKIPRYLTIVDSLPMTASGKVEKHILRGMILAPHNPGDRSAARRGRHDVREMLQPDIEEAPAGRVT